MKLNVNRLLPALNELIVINTLVPVLNELTKINLLLVLNKLTVINSLLRYVNLLLAISDEPHGYCVLMKKIYLLILLIGFLEIIPIEFMPIGTSHNELDSTQQ